MGKIYTIIFSFVFLVFAPFSAHAASLNFSPPSGSYGAGNTFSINVNVESSDQAMNAASGVVSFPRDKLEVVSISKQGSIFSLWPAEPSFSNSQGTVSFEGIVLNPGYQGTSGKILMITFRARSAGQANVSFSSGSVLANDGTGTNILRTLDTASYTITTPPPSPEPEPELVTEPIEEITVPIISLPIQQSEPVIETTEKPPWIYGAFLDYIFRPYTLAVGLIIILSSILLYGRHRFVVLRRSIRHKKTNDVEKVAHHSFGALKEDIATCVSLLEKAGKRRYLTSEEKAIIVLLRKHVRDTEKLVKKEFQDIRRRTEG